MSKLRGLAAYIGLKEYPIEETKKYLLNAKEYGIDFIFTSFHMPEADIKKDFDELLSYTEKINLPLVIDISKGALDLDKLPSNIGALRLDYGFTKQDIVDLTNNAPYLIELNASTTTKEYLEELIQMGLNKNNLRISHNFYPKPYTGLGINQVLEKNKMFKSFGFDVIAYLPSNSQKRPPLYKGLPTVEEHRNLDLTISSQELFAALCDGVCIGDAYVSNEDIEKILSFEDIYELPILIKKNLTENELDILKSLHRFRIDEGLYMKRSSTKRGVLVEPHDTNNINVFDITIDNNNYLRYKGEVGIALLPMENVGNVNVVGHIHPDAYTLCELIKPGSKFKFKIVGTIDE